MNRLIEASELTPGQQAFPEITMFEIHDDMHEMGWPQAHLELLDAWRPAFPHGPMTLADGRVQGYPEKGMLGQPLSDSTRYEDGFRFHDAVHIGLMAYTGWSPVMRATLGVKRRADPWVEQIDDGGRSINLEESILERLEISHQPVVLSRIKEVAVQARRSLNERGATADEFTADDLVHGLAEGIKLFQAVRTYGGGVLIANTAIRTVELHPPGEGVSFGGHSSLDVI